MSQRLKLADHSVGVLDSVSNASLMEVCCVLVLYASWRTAKCALIVRLCLISCMYELPLVNH